MPLPALPPQAPAYAIQAELDPVRHDVIGEQTLVYHNPRYDPLGEVHFQLYPNNFLPESRFRRKLQPLLNLDPLYPAGREAGWLHVESATVDGVPARFEEDETDGKLVLPTPLGRNGVATITLRFRTHVPQLRDRFGRFGEHYTLSYWHPRVAVLGPGGWDAPWREAYYQEFHDLHSRFRVDFTLPGRYTVGATGRRTRETHHFDGRKTVRYEAEGVRAFALVADPELEERTAEVDGVRVHLLTGREEGHAAPRMLAQSLEVVRFYNQLVGRYPYGDLTVVSTLTEPNGVEMPQLVLNGRQFSYFNRLPLDAWEFGWNTLNAHEIGHQWFFGVVGNDEAREPWIDEGLTTYLTMRYCEAAYGKGVGYLGRFTGPLQWLNQLHPTLDAYETYLQEAGNQLRTHQRWGATTPMRDLPPELTGTVYYARVARVLEMLRQEIGDEKFTRALRLLYQRNAFRNVSRYDVTGVFSEVTVRNYGSFFTTWLNDPQPRLDYRLAGWGTRRKPDGRYEVKVHVKQAGNTDFPVPVAAYTADGREFRGRYESPHVGVTIDTPAPVVAVAIDPDARSLDLDFGNNGGRSPLHVTPFAGAPSPFGRALVVGTPLQALDGRLGLWSGSLQNDGLGVNLGLVGGKPSWLVDFRQPIWGLDTQASQLQLQLSQGYGATQGNLDLSLQGQPRPGEPPRYGGKLGLLHRAAYDPTQPDQPAERVSGANVELSLNTRQTMGGLRPAGGDYRLGLEAASASSLYATPTLALAHHWELGWLTTLSARGSLAATLGSRPSGDPLRFERSGFRTTGLAPAGSRLAAANLELVTPLGSAWWPWFYYSPLQLSGQAFAAAGLGDANPAAEAGLGLQLGDQGTSPFFSVDWTPWSAGAGWQPGMIALTSGFGF